MPSSRNATATPFHWKFTRGDLHALLTRISEHEQQDTIAQLPAAVARYKTAIAGRGTCDHSLPFWARGDPRAGPARRRSSLPANRRQTSPESGVYEFVAGGIDEALKRATAGAGDGDVEVIGGADLARQFIQAGLIDEVIISNLGYQNLRSSVRLARPTRSPWTGLTSL